MGDIVSDIFGGGGGGGAAQQPASATQSIQQTAELPEWARGYAKDALAKGQALTDISQNPYQRYGGQRIADFGDLQKQAFAQAGPQGFQSSIGAYMSPYMQNVVDIQKREAARQSGIAGVQQQGQATMAGAFGGGRDAILRAERERNLMTQMGDIQQQGSQAAFDRATQQYNTGIGQLNTLGALQQAQAQRGLDIPYQEFLNEQNYPYKQLGFQSDLIRGLPLGQTSSKSMYEAAPSGAQQLASLGLGAYGLSKMMAAGGLAYAHGGSVEGYADGGSVDAPDNVQRIVSKLSDQQLQQAAQAAQARGDMDQLEAIQSEMAMRASERNGLASGVTNEMAERLAGGGILAFRNGGADGEETDSDTEYRDYIGSPNKAAMQEWLDAQRAIKEFKPREAMTLQERDALDRANYERYSKFAGEDPYAPMAARNKELAADLEQQRERGKGAVALQMAKTILRPGGTARAVGETFGTMGEGLTALDQAQAREKRALADREFNLADAQRKERMGLTRDAITATTEAQKDQIAADRAKLDALKARAKGATDAGRAFRTTGGGGAGKSPKLNEQLAAAEIEHETNPTDATLKKVTALRRAVSLTKTSDFGPGRAGAAADAIAIKLKDAETKALEKLSRTPDYREATKAQREIMEEKVRADIAKRVSFEDTDAGSGAGTGGTIKPIKLD